MFGTGTALAWTTTLLFLANVSVWTGCTIVSTFWFWDGFSSGAAVSTCKLSKKNLEGDSSHYKKNKNSQNIKKAKKNCVVYLRSPQNLFVLYSVFFS